MKNIFGLLLFLYTLHASAQVSETDIARAAASVSGRYGLSAEDVADYKVSDRYTREGRTHVYLIQTVHGHEVFNAVLQLHFGPEHTLAYSNSRFVPGKYAKAGAANPGIDPETAFYAAAKAVGMSPERAALETEKTDHPDRILLKNDALFYRPVRVTLGYENIGDEKLVLVYRFIIEPRGTGDMFNVRVDALTGKITGLNNRTLYCGAEHLHTANETCLPATAPLNTAAGAVYNAYPLGVESPNYGTRQLLTGVESTASPFGWHDTNGIPGAEYTITRGNNVFTYEDQADLDLPGYSPDGGGSLQFNFPLNLNQAPLLNMDAALTNLFVWNNFMHDVTYFYGFDEVSGNFQSNNYGHGGLGDDYVEAQGFDGSGTNNANFATPEDGTSPRMQMFLWHHNVGDYFTVNTPSAIAGNYTAGSATFGQPVPQVPFTADAVMVGTDFGSSSQGCGQLNNPAALNGKIALADRGGCTFVEKALRAQEAGAIALVVLNNVGGPAPTLGGDNTPPINIVCLSLSQADGNLIKGQLTGGNVNISIGGPTQEFVFDSNLDNGVICHEYGHGISNRLTGGPGQVDCLQNGEQAGEGWSDFFALVMTDRPGSTADEARGIGTFCAGQAPDGRGIRPYPYSHNMAVNPATYENVVSYTIPHGVGFVWCSMLWDLYWDLVAVYGHSHNLYATQGGNNKAIRLVVEGMRLQACGPGFVDARDAILQADEILYNGDNRCIIWKAFARRGLGLGADQGSNDVVGDETQAFDTPVCGFGIPETENGLQLTLYPNPATDRVYISASEPIRTVRITDISGKQISLQSINAVSGTVDTESLAPGMYLLHIQVGGTVITRRCIKK